MIPLIDLKLENSQVIDEVKSFFDVIFTKNAFVLGEVVQNFEEKFADYCGVKYAVAVNSGTSALIASLLALELKKGDEVITTPNTFFATAGAIYHAGLRPVFVDVNEDDFNIDVSKIEEKITSKTKVIVPVHLYGQCAEMDSVIEIAKRNDLVIIEDASQAHGALYKGNKSGSIGEMGCFSFYPSKNLGAFGEGGIVVTNNLGFAEKLKMIRDHGLVKKNVHKLIGLNLRMSGFQGVVLGVKLKYLDMWNKQRQEKAKFYDENLKNVVIPKICEGRTHVYHQYVILSKNRDKLQKHLSENGVDSVIQYPTPIHKQEAFRDYNDESYPTVEKLASEILCLPMFPKLNNGQLNKVCDLINKFEND